MEVYNIVETKVCTRCGKELPVEMFFPRESRSQRSWCRKCFAIDTQLRQIRNKKRAVEYKGGRCAHCGIDVLVVLEFHHPGNDKEMTWTKLKGLSWNKQKKELDKCILLCCNCHKIEHATFYREHEDEIEAM